MPTTAAVSRAALLLFLLVGCDPTTAPTSVRGVLAYRGRRLPGAVIVFTPDTNRGNDGPPLRAETWPDGSYSLPRDGPGGPQPGWYRVTIMAFEAPPAVMYGPQTTARRSLLPDKYQDPELSGLSCEVQSARDNVVNFDLNDALAGDIKRPSKEAIP